MDNLQAWQIHEIEAGIQEADSNDFTSDEEVAAVFAKWIGASQSLDRLETKGLLEEPFRR
jgi:hypothetical protein